MSDSYRTLGSMPRTELIPTSDVAAELGVTTRTVQRFAESGAIRFAHKGKGPNGGYLFTRAQVDAFKRSRVPSAT